ncbi:hypothetical protein GQX74_011034 [Glossina fuscipes]|nr:hypothetical protein GQX74_011034 [Glossina fuscipes]
MDTGFVKKLPTSFLSEDKCRFLSNFSQKTAEVELPEGFLIPSSPHYHIRISRFMPRVEVVQENNTATDKEDKADVITKAQLINTSAVKFNLPFRPMKFASVVLLFNRSMCHLISAAAYVSDYAISYSIRRKTLHAIAESIFTNFDIFRSLFKSLKITRRYSCHFGLVVINPHIGCTEY